jgi:hypothetical protein
MYCYYSYLTLLLFNYIPVCIIVVVNVVNMKYIPVCYVYCSYYSVPVCGVVAVGVIVIVFLFLLLLFI